MARDNPGAQTSSLSLAAALASKVVERRNSIPILSNLLLVSDGESLTVSGTDLDTEVSVATPTKLSSFSTTVEADVFGKIATAYCLDDDLHLDGKKLVAGKGPTFTLETLPADDYPHLTPVEPTATFELPASQLLADLQAVAPAISTEETRYYLNGVCFQVVDGNLRLVATDGHRMHMIERAAPEDLALSASILPRKCVKLLRAVMEAVPVAKVRLSFGGLKARFECGPVTINSKLIDGTYPDYNRVIPEETNGSLIVDASALLDCVNAACLVLDDSSTIIVLDLKAGVVTAKVPGGTEMTTALPGKQAGEGPDKVGFKARYLRPICAQFAAREMTMGLTDAAGPAIFTGAGSPLTAVLMPMRF